MVSRGKGLHLKGFESHIEKLDEEVTPETMRKSSWRSKLLRQALASCSSAQGVPIPCMKSLAHVCECDVRTVTCASKCRTKKGGCIKPMFCKISPNTLSGFFFVSGHKFFSSSSTLYVWVRWENGLRCKAVFKSHFILGNRHSSTTIAQSIEKTNLF